MPTNNFKLFDEKKANMMTDDDYATNQQRLNGVQSGVASSQLQNKTLYQTALMCYALAQLMAANGYDANDANAVSTFVNNLSRSMVQKVVDKASANDVAKQVAGKWVDAKQLGELKTDVADNYLSLLGGTMIGDLILHSDPTQSLQAATKQYVDKFCRISTGSYVGNGVYTSPTQINIGFKPKMIFIGEGLFISSLNPFNNYDEAPYKYVNGVRTNWFSFNSNKMGDTYPNTSTYSTFNGAMFVIDDIPLTVYYGGTNSARQVIVISASFDAGVVSITQTSYVAANSSFSGEFRDAKYQFNKKDTTYYYTAIG